MWAPKLHPTYSRRPEQSLSAFFLLFRLLHVLQMGTLGLHFLFPSKPLNNELDCQTLTAENSLFMLARVAHAYP